MGFFIYKEVFMTDNKRGWIEKIDKMVKYSEVLFWLGIVLNVVLHV